MTLLLIRHGETQWNREGRIQGRFDSSLTERGIAQAEAIGRFLRELPDMISADLVASPLMRARRTAEIIWQYQSGTRLRYDDRLREISVGSWDGLSRDDISAHAPGIFDGDGRYEWYFRSPDGETYDAFADRIAEWLSEAVKAPALVVVTHGIVSRVLRGIYAGLPRSVAIALPTAQDRIFRLSDGKIDDIPVCVSDDVL